MTKIKPSKSASIELLTALFNITNATNKDCLTEPTMKQNVEKVLNKNGFSIDLPLVIKTADDYTRLYTQAFNFAAQSAVWDLKHRKIGPDGADKQAHKVIQYMEGQGIIKVAKSLVQEIY